MRACTHKFAPHFWSINDSISIAPLIHLIDSLLFVCPLIDGSWKITWANQQLVRGALQYCLICRVSIHSNFRWKHSATRKLRCMMRAPRTWAPTSLRSVVHKLCCLCCIWVPACELRCTRSPAHMNSAVHKLCCLYCTGVLACEFCCTRSPAYMNSTARELRCKRAQPHYRIIIGLPLERVLWFSESASWASENSWILDFCGVYQRF